MTTFQRYILSKCWLSCVIHTFRAGLTLFLLNLKYFFSYVIHIDLNSKLKYTNTSSKPQSIHDENQQWIVAHFLAHQEPIYALEFNSSGRLLVSADSLGQYFNVFQINVNSFKSTRTVVKHLYSLYRGDTNAKVRNISFSSDSRWLAISSKRGTTHIFPLNSYGGAVNARTHSKPYVVNRTSKHQRTAGFVEQDLDMLHPMNGRCGDSSSKP